MRHNLADTDVAATGDTPPEKGFDAVIDGRHVTFLPVGPYLPHLRRDDEEAAWLAVVECESRHIRHVTERIILERGASPAKVMHAYGTVLRERALPEPVRQLLEMAPLIYRTDDWHGLAASDLGVERGDIAAWLAGENPPSELAELLTRLKPRLAFAARRLASQAEFCDRLLDALGGFDNAAASYAEKCMVPDGS